MNIILSVSILIASAFLVIGDSDDVKQFNDGTIDLQLSSRGLLYDDHRYSNDDSFDGYPADSGKTEGEIAITPIPYSTEPILIAPATPALARISPTATQFRTAAQTSSPTPAITPTALAHKCELFSATITAYSSTLDQGWGNALITSTGTHVHTGTMAVDPNVIPLGSDIFVPTFGWGKAEDTGGAVKGRHVDIWMTSRKGALEWGVKKLEIQVCKSDKKLRITLKPE